MVGLVGARIFTASNEIVESLSTRSAGVFELGQSTLYPMLYNLESKGLVQSRQKAGPNGRMRRYYQLTDKGKKKLDNDRQQWAALVKGMGALGLTRAAQPNPTGFAWGGSNA